MVEQRLRWLRIDVQHMRKDAEFAQLLAALAMRPIVDPGDVALGSGRPPERHQRDQYRAPGQRDQPADIECATLTAEFQCHVLVSTRRPDVECDNDAANIRITPYPPKALQFGSKFRGAGRYGGKDQRRQLLRHQSIGVVAEQ